MLEWRIYPCLVLLSRIALTLMNHCSSQSSSQIFNAVTHGGTHVRVESEG